MKIQHASLHNGIVRIDDKLSNLDALRSVTHIGRSLSICYNLHLRELSLPSLQYIGNQLSIAANDDLSKIAFPSLIHVAWVALSDLPSLGSFCAENLTEISHGFIADNSPKLSSVFIPSCEVATTSIVNTALNTVNPFAMVT
ncbi:hypothetical protein N9V62_00530 [Porticoccaceae bacterium]|nr:hypothetical protein [Porticoccaceae bacterium]